MLVMNPIRKVIVIGAGASGIAAATRLYERGIRNILVIEAENRIGGRVCTIDLPDDDGIIELGAQWIHGEKGNVVYEMAVACNLVQADVSSFQENCVIVRSSSEILDREISSKMFQLFYDIDKNKNVTEIKKSTSTADYYIPRLEKGFEELHLDPSQSYLKDEFIEWCHQMKNCADGSDSWYNSYISTLDEYVQCDGNLLTSWKMCGYKTLFSMLMEKCKEISGGKFLDDNIITNKSVKKITLENNLVHVKCADGDIYSAHHVILSVSLGVLKEKYGILLDGINVPEKKILAIKNFGFSAVHKIFLKFPRQWLPDNVHCLCVLWNEKQKKEYAEKKLDWLTGIFAIIHCGNAPNVLCVWIVGASARNIEQLSETDIQSQITRLLQKRFGKRFDIPDADYCLRSTWSSNDNFRGAYCFRTPASEKLGITSDYLSSPILNNNNIPVILFAGEATHPHYYSTVHGAVESGWREADRILSLNKV